MLFNKLFLVDLTFSHINGAGFWIYKEYFNLTIGRTFMVTITSFIGFAGMLIINLFI
ncbi:hypothetical protein [Metabacillus sp. FJAT-52054]|uniref:Uncharacterized protein n=1 Tax=Metabacillus sediminis TaxID=3117746 RepID=A0ABZ2NGH9_9BACI